MNIRSVEDVIIRAAVNDDKEKVVALVFSVLAEYGLQSDPENRDADLNDIEENYIRRGGLFDLIEDGEGNLLGTIGLFPVDKNVCELRKMYFMRQARGFGLGRFVLERTVNRAREIGFKTIVLETASVLKEAIRLYTRFGFTPFNSSHLAARCDQAYILKLTE